MVFFPFLETLVHQFFHQLPNEVWEQELRCQMCEGAETKNDDSLLRTIKALPCFPDILRDNKNFEQNILDFDL